MTKSSDIWVLVQKNTTLITLIVFFLIFIFVASFLLLKCNWSLCLVPSLGTLSPSTFPQQVIHEHSYVSPLPSFRDHSYIWKGFWNTHVTRVSKHSFLQASHTPAPVGTECTHHCPWLPPRVWLPSASCCHGSTNPDRSPYPQGA